MKGVIRGNSKVALTGSLTINRDIVKTESDNHQDSLVLFRLKQEYPELKIDVFAGIVPKIAARDGFRVPYDKFRIIVRQELFKLVKLIHPETVFTEDTNVHTLYDTVLQYLEDRDNKIKAYKG